MKHIRFSEQITVGAPQEAVFNFSQDYGRRLEWDTFLKRAELINGATRAGLGVKAYCVSKGGYKMETEYVSYQAPKVTAVKISKGPYMFKNFVGSWNFRKLSEQETEVLFTYAFSLRFPFNFIGFYIKWDLAKNVRERLKDLKRCVEA